MSHFMRKHQKGIMLGLAALLIPAFIFWGGYRGTGGNGSAQNGDTVVVNVGGTPITVEDFRQALDERLQQVNRRSATQETYKDLAASGAADDVLENLITRTLFTEAVSRHPLQLDHAFLVDQIKKNPMFKDAKGHFDPAKWNQWIDETAGSDSDWNAEYAQIAGMEARRLFMEQVSASARVLDSEVKKQFAEDNTELQVKYVLIDPKVTPTDAQIEAYYKAHTAKYDIPEQRVAEFVAVSMLPPRPPLVDELVTRAKKGEDFAALAKKYSDGPDKDSGGEMGWVSQQLGEPSYQEPLFKLPVNGVSDAVEGPGGNYYIYKVEQERTDQVTKAHEVKAREIEIHPTLTAAEKTARTSKADALAKKAQASKDLKAAAKAAGLEVQTSGKFSASTLTIANVPAEDTRSFRTALSKLDKGAISDVVAAPDNLYVATISQVIPPVPQPLSAVRNKVIADTKAEIQASPAHEKEVAKLVAEIQAKAHSLQDIQTMFPDLKAEVNETKAFTVKDFDYSGGLFWNPREIYEAVGTAKPGKFAGPIRDMIGREYFIELVSRKAPDAKAWKDDYPKEEKKIRERLRSEKESERLDDYLKDLRQSAGSKMRIVPNTQVISEVLGVTGPGSNESSDEKAKKASSPTSSKAKVSSGGGQKTATTASKGAASAGGKPATSKAAAKAP